MQAERVSQPSSLSPALLGMSYDRALTDTMISAVQSLLVFSGCCVRNLFRQWPSLGVQGTADEIAVRADCAIVLRSLQTELSGWEEVLRYPLQPSIGPFWPTPAKV